MKLERPQLCAVRVETSRELLGGLAGAGQAWRGLEILEVLERYLKRGARSGTASQNLPGHLSGPRRPSRPPSTSQALRPPPSGPPSSKRFGEPPQAFGCYSTPGCGNAGERAASTCAIDVEGHKRRPPSKVGP